VWTAHRKDVKKHTYDQYSRKDTPMCLATWTAQAWQGSAGNSQKCKELLYVRQGLLTCFTTLRRCMRVDASHLSTSALLCLSAACSISLDSADGPAAAASVLPSLCFLALQRHASAIWSEASANAWNLSPLCCHPLPCKTDRKQKHPLNHHSARRNPSQPEQKPAPAHSTVPGCQHSWL